MHVVLASEILNSFWSLPPCFNYSYSDSTATPEVFLQGRGRSVFLVYINLMYLILLSTSLALLLRAVVALQGTHVSMVLIGTWLALLATTSSSFTKRT